MKQCSRCAAEFHDSATVCPRCGQHTDVEELDLDAPFDPYEDEQVSARMEAPLEPALPVDDDAADIEPVPLVDSDLDSPSTSLARTTEQPVVAGLRRRELMAIALAVLGGGTVTFALMVASGTPLSDAAASGHGSALARASEAPPMDPARAGPRWNTSNREWIGNRRQGAAFEVFAENKVPIWQRSAHPILVVRCIANRVEAFVFIESAATIESKDENHTVRLGFDDGPDVTERWPDSAEHDALFAPDGRAFAGRLVRARTLRFGYTPHNAPSVVASFPVSGLGELMAPHARQCGAK